MTAVVLISQNEPRPGGHSAKNAHRVGSPHTQQVSGKETVMVRTIASDLCSWYGCEWDWGVEPCGCGQPHTFRICVRCLYSDDVDCPATDVEPVADVEPAGVDLAGVELDVAGSGVAA